MEQISNRTLAFLLLMAIVVSVGSTIISINRLNQLVPRITGMATDTATGRVNVTLANVNSISVTDSQITFGSCSPTGSFGCNATSNSSNTNFGCTCTGGSGPDNITVKNDGNTNINVSVKTNVLASEFIGGADPYGAEMWFSVRNASTNGGCFNATIGASSPANFSGTKGMQWDWKNFSAADTEYLACANLTPTTSVNAFSLFAKLFIPADAEQKSDANATLTFTATNW